MTLCETIVEIQKIVSCAFFRRSLLSLLSIVLFHREELLEESGQDAMQGRSRVAYRMYAEIKVLLADDSSAIKEVIRAGHRLS